MIENPKRLEAVVRTGLLDSPAEERFDRITRIAAFLEDHAIAAFSLLDGNREWFKSCFGVQLEPLPIERSLGATVVTDGDLVICMDALDHPVLCDHPLVKGPPYVRFYAGYPVRSPDGQVIGVLSLLDFRPHRSIVKLKVVLRDLAAIIVSEIYLIGLDASVRSRMQFEFDALTHRALTDELTGLSNRGAIVEFLARELSRAHRRKTELAVMLVDVDHFKSVNDRFGHLFGDHVLRKTGERLKETVRTYDGIGRYGGEEFLVVMPDCPINVANVLGDRMRSVVEKQQLIDEQGQAMNVSVSIGVAVGGTDQLLTTHQILAAADQALYRAKNGGRNRVEVVQVTKTPGDLLSGR